MRGKEIKVGEQTALWGSLAVIERRGVGQQPEWGMEASGSHADGLLRSPSEKGADEL